MNTRSAASAPHCAPDTGASTIDAPRAATAAAVSRVSHGSDDEVSTSNAPARRPAAMPSAASTVSRTTRPLGSMVNTTSAPCAASRALRHAMAAPCAARKRSSAAGVTSKPCTRWPASPR